MAHDQNLAWRLLHKSLLTACILQPGAIFYFTSPMIIGRIFRFLDSAETTDGELVYTAIGAVFLLVLIFVLLVLFLGVLIDPPWVVVPLFLLNLWAYIDGLAMLNYMIALMLSQSDIAYTPDYDLRLMIWPIFAVLISGWFALRQVGGWVGRSKRRRRE
ncbi:MAG: hypothetical protein R3360_00240 [Alphaproteobacteria bacterium]|nr:hypothetical protein [Alphaproteobacteria bacterium]